MEGQDTAAIQAAAAVDAAAAASASAAAASAAPALDAFLASDAKHSMRAFADMIGAKSVKLSASPANINTREDLVAAQEHLDGH